MVSQMYPLEVSVSDELAMSKSSAESPWCVYAFFDGVFGEPPIAEYPATLSEGLAVQAACRIQNALNKARALGIEEGAEKERERFAYPFSVILSPITEQIAAQNNTRSREFDKVGAFFAELVKRAGGVEA